MKLALLISGYLRGFVENIQCIKDNIIQSYDCDIYIHITEDNETDKYFNKRVSYDTISKLLNPKVWIVSKNANISSNTLINNILNQNYKKYWLNDEIKKMSVIENQSYDIIVSIRPDVNIKTRLNYCTGEIQIPIDSKIDITKLSKKTDNHICDMIAFGNPENMNKYFNFYLEINKLIVFYNTFVNETLLYYYLNDNNINYHLIDIEYIVILSLCNTIAITGDSGSGKTTISKILNDIFSNSFVLECDRYHKWERNDNNWEKYTHLNPEANYIAKMSNDVFDLKIGNTVYQIDYDHANGRFTDKKAIEPCENIIVCGLHCMYIPESIINLKIYMDTDDNLRIPWKIKRDVVKRGYSVDKIYDQIKKRDHDFYKYIKPQKNLADIVICFYTNEQFVFETYDINRDIVCYLKIGIKSSYNFNNLWFNEIEKIETNNNFTYIYFNYVSNYDDIIKNVIKNIITNN